MFETFAALSTISMIIIFVVLYRIDQSARREEAAKARGRAITLGMAGRLCSESATFASKKTVREAADR